MKWPESPLVLGKFLERLHRFGALVRVQGRDEYCHVPNSGRLRELLTPGAVVALVDHSRSPRHRAGTGTGAPKRDRKTRFAIRLAFYQRTWVCIEANIAPRLLREAWEEGHVPWLRSFPVLRSEVPLDRHTRFDLLASDPGKKKRTWIEVKCVTLVRSDGFGYFPDAPSERASKHLRELMALSRRKNTQCVVVFVLQNPRGRGIRPKEDTDPVFAATLRQARRKGVVLKAYRARVEEQGAWLGKEIPVDLGKAKTFK